MMNHFIVLSSVILIAPKVLTSFNSYVRPNPSERTVMGYVHDALETGNRSVLIAINPEDRQGY